MGLKHHTPSIGDNLVSTSATTLPAKKPAQLRMQKPLPKGWDVDRVNRLLKNYQPLLQEYAEDNYAQNDSNIRMNVMKVPVDLVPAIREMIQKYKAA